MLKLTFGMQDLFAEKKSLKLSNEEKIKFFSSPINEACFQSLGKLPLTVSGSVVVSGEKAKVQYSALKPLLGMSDTLKSPFGEMRARLVSLELCCENNPDTLKISFKFLEVKE